MRLFLVLTALVALVGTASISLEDLEFHAWKMKFGKIYNSIEEKARRKMSWLENRKLVLVHNMLADQGIKSYRLGMNHFADMSNQEYRTFVLMSGLRSFNRTERRHEATFFRQKGGAALPDTVDWRVEGYVTEVKNQGHCGSCWAFSVTGSLEGQTFKNTGELPSLSEQQLLDCSTRNNGCNGGSVEKAFEYIINNYGIDTEDSYPYVAHSGSCRFNPATVGATCSNFSYIMNGDENALQEAVASVGPISVGIDASQRSFQLYHSGVYDEPMCSSTDLDHDVLVVGYGTEESIQHHPFSQDYWLVKNSWGVNWGDKGYIKMSRNKYNQCGIATNALFPLV